MRARWRNITPVPAGTPPPSPSDKRHFKYGDPQRTWAYRTADGALIGYVLEYLYDSESLGRRTRRQCEITWCKTLDGKARAWRKRRFKRPFPLYALQQAELDRSCTVHVFGCEGDADVARPGMPDACCTTWPGGDENISGANWDLLLGCVVYIWQRESAGSEHDCEFSPASEAISQRLTALNIEHHLVRYWGVPDGSDLGDAMALPFDASDVRS